MTGDTASCNPPFAAWAILEGVWYPHASVSAGAENPFETNSLDSIINTGQRQLKSNSPPSKPFITHPPTPHFQHAEATFWGTAS